MILTFKLIIEYGKFDTSETDFRYEVSDTEYELLKRHYDSDKSMYSISEISDLVLFLTDEAIKEETKITLETDYESVEDYIEEALEDGEIESEEEWDLSMIYQFSLEWPKEFEN